MAWNAITTNDLQTVLSLNEITVMQRDIVNAGGTAPAATIIADVTNYVRGFAGRVVKLGPVGTIPDKLRAPALDIIAYRLVNRMRGNPGTERVEANKRAEDLLRLAGNRMFDLEEPLIPTENSVAPQSIVTPRTRSFTSSSQDGI